MTKPLAQRLERLEQAQRAPQQPITGLVVRPYGEPLRGAPLPGGLFHLAPAGKP